LYRHPRNDLYHPRGTLALLRGASAYAEVPGLEEAVRSSVTLERVKRIAETQSRGRLLAINTTDVDTQEAYPWDLVEESRRAAESGDAGRIHQILLASAAIPGVFPPREIDGVLYVDGSVTGNILFGGSAARTERDSFLARWKSVYPGTRLPKLRYWIILNNEIRWPPEVVRPTWSTLISRSMTAASRAATLNDIRILMLESAVERLRDGADIEVRIVAVPDGWVAPQQGAFLAANMNALADLGERMGADPASWRTSLADTDYTR
jgi:hypothetical protein